MNTNKNQKKNDWWKKYKEDAHIALEWYIGTKKFKFIICRLRLITDLEN